MGQLTNSSHLVCVQSVLGFAHLLVPLSVYASVWHLSVNDLFPFCVYKLEEDGKPISCTCIHVCILGV